MSFKANRGKEKNNFEDRERVGRGGGTEGEDDVRDGRERGSGARREEEHVRDGRESEKEREREGGGRLDDPPWEVLYQTIVFEQQDTKSDVEHCNRLWIIIRIGIHVVMGIGKTDW